ncbi:MAG: MBL fold metallo-hydrolase, partial [Deltaproteobacteria bacterium]|nr:MBL fold metallo-hydrolase [Deltaproteobacteria bacterium]
DVYKRQVTDFEAHKAKMEGFHKRYMASRRIAEAWAKMVRQLDIEIIAPQHGAILRGKEMAQRFIDWVESMECGIDLIAPRLSLPQ